MLVQLVITDAAQRPYNLRVQPGRYKIRLTSVQYVTTDPARGDLVEFESILFRQLYGTNQYLSICDNISAFDKTGEWQADINGPVSIGINHLQPGGELNFSRCVLYLDMTPVS